MTPPASDADQLIIELIRSPRAATEDEIRRIIERMAAAPFDDRARSVPVSERGLAYLGRVLGRREVSLFYHLVKRVVIERQWITGTTEDSYTYDLRQAIRHPDARLAVYERRGGAVAAVTVPTDLVLPESHQGTRRLPLMCVVYSVDRCAIVSGYQARGMETLAIPEAAVWLT